MHDIFKGMSVSKNLIFGLFLFVFVSMNFASSASGQDATRKVKVIPVDGGPSVLVESMPPDTKSYPAISCLDQKFKETYLGTQEKNEAFLALQEKEAKCATGYAQAATLSAKYVDMANSAVALTTRIASLQKVLAYLDNLTDVNGLSLRAIPAGDVAESPYPTAVNISVQCLKDSVGNIIAPRVAVGDEQSTPGQLFSEVSERQSALLEQVRKDNDELKAKADQAKAGKPKSKQSKANEEEKVDPGESVDLGFFFLEVVGKVAKDFMPVLPEDLEQSYGVLAKNNSYLSLDISFFLKDGEVQRNSRITALKTFRKWLQAKQIFKDDPIRRARIKKLEKLISHPTLQGQFVGVNLKLDQITYDDVEVPEETVLIDIKSATANHLKRYEELKEQFEKARDAVKLELDTLKKNNYNCG